MIYKDRYSVGFVFLFIGILIAIYLIRYKGLYSAISLSIFSFPLLYNLCRSGRLHLTEGQKRTLDGTKTKAIQSKIVDGTDFYLNQNIELIACGIGSRIMQYLGKRG